MGMNSPMAIVGHAEVESDSETTFADMSVDSMVNNFNMMHSYEIFPIADAFCRVAKAGPHKNPTYIQRLDRPKNCKQRR